MQSGGSMNSGAMGQNRVGANIQNDWTPEQALAVVELLDDMREVIWKRYQLQLDELIRDQRCANTSSESSSIGTTDPLF